MAVVSRLITTSLTRYISTHNRSFKHQSSSENNEDGRIHQEQHQTTSRVEQYTPDHFNKPFHYYYYC